MLIDEGKFLLIFVPQLPALTFKRFITQFSLFSSAEQMREIKMKIKEWSPIY